jgi:hypothetical protein
MIAQIVTAWIGNASHFDPYRPRLHDDYPAIYRCVDATEQDAAQVVPEPNLYVVQVWCDAATLTLIEADPRYLVLEAQR